MSKQANFKPFTTLVVCAFAGVIRQDMHQEWKAVHVDGLPRVEPASHIVTEPAMQVYTWSSGGDGALAEPARSRNTGLGRPTAAGSLSMLIHT